MIWNQIIPALCCMELLKLDLDFLLAPAPTRAARTLEMPSAAGSSQDNLHCVSYLPQSRQGSRNFFLNYTYYNYLQSGVSKWDRFQRVLCQKTAQCSCHNIKFE